ncbi:MAG: Gfo/Idh/MocA family oxidoreductase [Nitrospiraceae bacterium]|nr:Gfo/Idh/MocA family oxidoreductase [Nitrospiraceae bacterium]
MLKVGVVGAGYLGQHHARLYSELSAEMQCVKLAAVIDSDPARAEEIASKYGCPSFGTLESALDEVDALSIVAPTTFHHNIALKCMNAGKDILVEKPIAASIEEADEMIRISGKTGRIVQVGHLERFNPALITAAKMFSEPCFFESERVGPFVGRGVDVDITLDLMIHDIDIVLSILKASGCDASVKNIDAFGTSLITENIDMCKAWIEFECGARALFTASRVSMDRARKMRVFQSGAYIDVDYQRMELSVYTEENRQIIQRTVPVAKSEPLREELRHFINCVLQRTTPLVTASDGRDALKIALDISNMIKGNKR